MSAAPSEGELVALRERVARLEREQAFSRTLLDSAAGIVTRVSLDGTIEFINRPSPADSPLIGQSIYSFVPADQAHVVRSALERCASTLKSTSYEVAARALDGTTDWYATNVAPILEGEKLVGLTLVSINASHARRTEEALRASQTRLKLALDLGNVGVWSWDQKHDVVEWDQKLTAMFGLPPDATPRTVAEYLALIPEAQRAAMAAHVERALETGIYPDFELEAEGADGPHWFIIKGGLLRGPGGEVIGLTGGVVDVTERRRIEQRLRETQKLEALGQLSAGIAHNFNNMLAVIIPALELTRMRPAAADPTLLDDALASAQNAAQLVRQLMVFSQRTPGLSAHRESLADVVRRAVLLCQQTFERHLTLELSDLEAGSFASVESGPMEQAVMNMLLNARDAVAVEPGRPGRIEVSVRAVGEPEARRRHLEARGAYVELRVSDTGCGMDATTRGRMLEPFFTTKPPGRGTGLGLATAWATVQAHRGFLDCQSELGRGTTFYLLLPAQEARVQTERAEAPPARDRGGAGRVVLIVDDEEAVSRTSALMLRDAGFRVLTAASGDEALRLAEGSSFDVVLLDYSMPGLSAADTLAGLRRRQPQLPIICLSGLGISLAGATVQLLKPVSRTELLAVLERVVQRGT